MHNPARFVERFVSLAKDTVVGRPAPAVRKDAGGFADSVMLTILCLKQKKGETYRSVIGLLHGVERTRELLDLSRGQIPDPSTVYQAMDRLTMAFFRSLLQQTTTLHEVGDLAAIDASSFDRVAASRRYATRTVPVPIAEDHDSRGLLDRHDSGCSLRDNQAT